MTLCLYPPTLVSHARTQLRYANAEIAQQLHLIQNSRHLLQQRGTLMMVMTNAHSLQTPSYAHRFFLSQAILMVARLCIRLRIISCPRIV